MSTIPFVDLAKLVDDAGFPAGTSQATGIAVIAAESGRDPNAKHTNDDGSVDRGLWQIDDLAHPDVTDDIAFEPVRATAAAFTISKGGTNYRPWSAYNNGSYKAFLGEARVALDAWSRIKWLQSQVAVLATRLGAETTAADAATSQLRRVEDIVDQAKMLLESA